MGPNDGADQKVENSCNNDGYKEILSLKEIKILNQKVISNINIYNFHQERQFKSRKVSVFINSLNIINEIYK